MLYDYAVYCTVRIWSIIFLVNSDCGMGQVSKSSYFASANDVLMTTILHHLKDFINPWPLNYCSHIVRYFYLVVHVAYRQFYMFSILYSCACSLNYLYIYFMHINVSGRSVLLFNKLIS